MRDESLGEDSTRRKSPGKARDKCPDTGFKGSKKETEDSHETPAGDDEDKVAVTAAGAPGKTGQARDPRAAAAASHTHAPGHSCRREKRRQAVAFFCPDFAPSLNRSDPHLPLDCLPATFASFSRPVVSLPSTTCYIAHSLSWRTLAEASGSGCGYRRWSFCVTGWEGKVIAIK